MKRNTATVRLGLLAAGIAAGWLFSAAVPAGIQALRTQNTAQAQEIAMGTIGVTGRAEVAVKPDLATLLLGVETRGKTAAEAQEANAERMDKVMETLKRLGIPAKQIQTSGFTVETEYNYESNKRELIGYRVLNQLTVRTTDLEKVGTLIDEAVRAGANQVHGVQFGLQDDQAAQAQALKLATANAKAKAMAIAQGLGIQLGRVMAASDETVEVRPFVVAREAKAVKLAADAASTPIAPGEVKVTAAVQVHFALGN